MKSKFWNFFFLVLLVAGCKSAPVKLTSVTQGHWSARALVKDKQHAQAFILILDFYSVRDHRLRIDAMSTLGQHVATFVVNDGEVRYYTSRLKRFYVGRAKPDVLRSILAIPLDPRWLQNILWDEPVSATGWTCESGADKLVSKCFDEDANLAVLWLNRKGTDKAIHITHTKAEIQLNLHSFTPEIENADHLFDLQPPPGFRRTNI